MKRTGAAALAALVMLSPLASVAAQVKVLYHFSDPPNGLRPAGTLLDGGDGKLYGTTLFGGAANCGIVFAKPTGRGALKHLWDFGGQTDGCQPYGRLIRDPAGALYGTTYSGGSGYGTVFKLTPPANVHGAWTETVLWRFGNAEGANPSAGLTFANGVDASGGLYGTTEYGGLGWGTVFRLMPPRAAAGARATSWRATAIYKFKNRSDGAHPRGGLLMDGSGILYGTTNVGGRNANAGVVFKLTPQEGQKFWANTPLYRFKGASDGANPFYVDLVAEFDNGQIIALYGTAKNGAEGKTCGVVFRLQPGDPAWMVTVLTRFKCTDAQHPQAGVVFVNGIDATDGLYGTTEHSDPDIPGYGTVYKVSPRGAGWRRTTLWNLSDPTLMGARPQSAVTVIDGAIYGTTWEGGTGGGGTLFRIIP